jgi:hypothetical protein
MMMARGFLPKGHHELSDAAAAVGNCDWAKTLRFSDSMQAEKVRGRRSKLSGNICLEY